MTLDYSVVVYRGESQIYKTPCQPNIFRNKNFSEDEFFELNLFSEMAANHLTTGQTHLEMAIDAQHGGFPSRLLDVTYNILTALYFAVTPYYTKEESSEDDKDGAVYLFFLQKSYCPTGKNITEAYDACITHDVEWFANQDVFQKNHKLIDHIKKNPRIIAQQGAFLLFQGDNLSSFPKFRYKKILVKKEDKAQVRTELKNLFGIHTGSIYPEEFNLVQEMVSRSRMVSSDSFSLQNEVELVFQNLKDTTMYYIDRLRWADPTEYLELVMDGEKDLWDYHIRMKHFLDNIQIKTITKEYKEKLREDFNQLIEDFANQAKEIMCENRQYEVDISLGELLIGKQ